MNTTDPTEHPTCTAKNRQGNRCARRPIPGGTVCRMHGGAAPQVRRRANLRLLELVDPAIATLAREMTAADKSADRQRAANSILDRSGLGRTSKVEVDDAKQLLFDRIMALREDTQDNPN